MSLSLGKWLKRSAWAALPMLPDPAYLYVRNCMTFKKVTNPWQPRTFNDHMLRLMNGKRDDRRRVFADKLATRDYVEARIGQGYLPELYMQTQDPDSIDFDALPGKFVIKASHGSNMNHIVFDKAALDLDALRVKMRRWMQTDYGKAMREYVYVGLKPRIFAERLLEFGEGKLCYDYKFFCFHGETRMIHVIVDRAVDNQFSRRHAFFDPDWKPIPDLTWGADLTDLIVPKPDCLDEMKDLARKMTHDFDFLRADFYVLDGRPILGELTNFSDGGNALIKPAARDAWLGSFFERAI